MKCPKCGYPAAKYKKSRKIHWRGRGKFEEGGHSPRKDHRAFCPNCGHEWTEKPKEPEVNGSDENDKESET